MGTVPLRFLLEKKKMAGIEPYVLHAKTRKLGQLMEVPAFRNADMVIRLPKEKIYKTPPVEFLGHTWDALLGPAGGRIYKISARIFADDDFEDMSPDDKAKVDKAFADIYAHCAREFGAPLAIRSEFQGWHPQFQWTTSQGVIILMPPTDGGWYFVMIEFISRKIA